MTDASKWWTQLRHVTEFKWEAFQDTSKTRDMMPVEVALTGKHWQPTWLLDQTKSLEGDLENNDS